MSSLETTELKLKTTPTGGNEAHKSPYYRRLVSAGYKGFLQGTLGGASLYGAFGLVIGGLVAIPFALVFPASAGAAAFLIAPVFAGLGILKGADTFGQIGSMAAITAESSDLSEQRRYLLDRYYDLPDGPEGDREAKAIEKELLARATDQGAPPHMFHWKTVLIGAAIGAALILTGLAVTSSFGTASLAVAKIATTLGLPAAFTANIGAVTATVLGFAGALAGGLTGATIGIDRYYIRKWFDHTQDIVHPSNHQDYGLMERHRQFERIKEASKEDQKTKQQLQVAEPASTASAPIPIAAPASEKPTASLDTPATKITEASTQRRIKDLQKVLEVSAI